MKTFGLEVLLSYRKLCRGWGRMRNILRSAVCGTFIAHCHYDGRKMTIHKSSNGFRHVQR